MNLNLDADLARRMAAPGDVEAALEAAKAEYRRLAALGSEDKDWPVTGWFHCAEAAQQLDLIKEKAAEIRRNAEDSQRFTAIITQCDEAQYSPVESARMGDVYSEGVNLISRIESVIKR